MPVGPQRPRPPMSEESRLKGRVTRARNTMHNIEWEYGSVDIPEDNPLFAKRNVAKQKHWDAMTALREYRESQAS